MQNDLRTTRDSRCVFTPVTPLWTFYYPTLQTEVNSALNQKAWSWKQQRQTRCPKVVGSWWLVSWSIQWDHFRSRVRCSGGSRRVRGRDSVHAPPPTVNVSKADGNLWPHLIPDNTRFVAEPNEELLDSDTHSVTITLPYSRLTSLSDGQCCMYNLATHRMTCSFTS